MNKVITKIEKNICYISLNNPEKHNALDVELMTELVENLTALKNDLGSLKALVLSGKGKSFCAGADLNWMREMVNYSLEENTTDSKKLYNLFHALYSFPLPVIVKAHGHVFGGGLGLLGAADYVLADDNTKFCFSEVKLGLAPSVISSFILSKCNPSHSQALMTSGLVFNKSTAYHFGLINDSLTKEKLKSVLKSYQESGQAGLIATKKLCLAQRAVQPEDFKELTIKTISDLRTTDEAQKRMTSFLNK